MEDSFFRKLDPDEVEVFKQWARDNFDPFQEPSEVWHPVVRAEWNRLLNEYHDPEGDAVGQMMGRNV